MEKIGDNNYALKWEKQGNVYVFQLERTSTSGIQVIENANYQQVLGEITSQAGDQYRIRSCDSQKRCGSYSTSLTVAKRPEITSLTLSPGVAQGNETQTLTIEYRDAVKCWLDPAKNSWLSTPLTPFVGVLSSGRTTQTFVDGDPVNHELVVTCESAGQVFTVDKSIRQIRLSQKLAAPTNLTATSPSAGSVQLSWSPVQGADQYQVQHKLKTASEWTSHTPLST